MRSARAQGYASWTGPETLVEADTITCCHCNALVIVHAKQDPSDLGGFCTLCSKHTCSKCAGAGKCVPFERRLDAMERRAKLGG